MQQEINYRDLLIKYMRIVVRHEGVSFIPTDIEWQFDAEPGEELPENEVKELIAIEKEVITMMR